MAEAYIEVAGPQGLQQVPLDQNPITIGRLEDNRLALDDPLVSRHHCVIEASGGGYRVRDLNSSNGTRVNGQLVKVAELSPADILLVGRSEIRLVTAAAEPVEDMEEVEQLDELEEIAEPQEDPWAAELRERDRSTVDDEASPDIGNGNDPEQVMLRLAESLPDKSFDEQDIALHTARGAVAHASRQNGTKSRTAEQAEAVSLLRLLLLVCFRIRATDIHVEPKDADYQVRIRVDGTMVDVVRLSKPLALRLTSLVKVLSDIDIAQRSIVQEGHFSSRLPDRRVDYRVSFAPSVYGQKLVIRILDAASAPMRANDLQLPPWMLEQLTEAIQSDAGMLLVCGPTGSGKTTTLYSLIRSLDTDQRNVVTIEDPVEIQIDGVTQIPVNEAQGNTFSALLRSLLRQDPDVMLVGEIRDPETAKIGMQAAITGHLVFSTIHTRDTIGTIFRLLDLGVEPYMVANGLHLVLSQRLVRKLCPFCKQPVKPTPAQLGRMGPVGEGVKEIFNRGGCPRCLGTGYAGRRAVFELLRTSDTLRDVILKSPTAEEINKTLAGTQFVKLLQSGYQLVAEGTSSLEEIERATSM